MIAHELCHDELFARLGWWRVKRQIPQWFNEGLALMVDYRFSNPAVWDRADSTQTKTSAVEDDDDLMPFARRPMLKLSDLETTRDFFGGRLRPRYAGLSDRCRRGVAVAGNGGSGRCSSPDQRHC